MKPSLVSWPLENAPIFMKNLESTWPSRPSSRMWADGELEQKPVGILDFEPAWDLLADRLFSGAARSDLGFKFRREDLDRRCGDHRNIRSLCAGAPASLSGRYLESIWISALATVFCLLLSYPAAFVISSAPKRWKPVLLLAVVLPFWTNTLCPYLHLRPDHDIPATGICKFRAGLSVGEGQCGSDRCRVWR